MILIILEPRISGEDADEACLKLAKSDWVRYEAQGFSGGIRVLWNRAKISFIIIHVHRFFVHATLQPVGVRSWELTTIYASSSTSIRKGLWKELSSICTHEPWVCIGDFNCTLMEGERATSGRLSSSFKAWKKSEGLLDLGFKGPKYTRNHGNNISSKRSARLDRYLCDEVWRRSFPNATLKHLSYCYSDHYPIMPTLSSKPKVSLGSSMPFRFEAVWLQQKDFKNLLENK